METNPKLTLAHKQPYSLFKVDVPKAIIHSLETSEILEGVNILDVPVHIYRTSGKNTTVICYSEHSKLSCPHCDIGHQSSRVFYQIDKTVRSLTTTIKEDVRKPTDGELALLSYATKHKHPYALSSFNAVGVYPIAFLTYHDLIIKDTYKQAKTQIKDNNTHNHH